MAGNDNFASARAPVFASPSNGDMARTFLHAPRASLLIRRLERFGPLTDRERDSLDGLAEQTIAAAPREQIFARERAAGTPLVVLGGFLRESFTDAEGRIQTVAFRLPGDVVGTDLLWSSRYGFDLDALTPCRLARAPFVAGDRGGERLRALVRTLCFVEEARLKDRLRLVGRARAEERLLHLLVELNARQSHVLDGVGERAWLPCSQTEIANATGLTNVYVSKTMTRLRERGAITIEGDMVALHDAPAIRRHVDFTDHFARAVEQWRDPAWA